MSEAQRDGSDSRIYECPRCIDVPPGSPGPCVDCPLGEGCRECESENAIHGTSFCPTCTELRAGRLAEWLATQKRKVPPYADPDPCAGMLVSRKREGGGLA